MRFSKSTIFAILLLSVMIFSSACGSGADSANTGDSTVTEDASKTEATVKASDGSELLGKWVNQGDSSKFANITKDDTGFTWEDNDGKYKAVFKDDVLTIDAGKDNYVTAVLDKTTGILTLQVNGEESKFVKEK